MVEKGGGTCSASGFSDATLRFLAMLAALLADDPTRFCGDSLSEGRMMLVLMVVYTELSVPATSGRSMTT